MLQITVRVRAILLLKRLSNTRAFQAMSFLAVFAFVSSYVIPSSIAQEASTDESFYMFNALWFKEDGGAEKYAEYLQAAGPFVEKHGGKSDDSYAPGQEMIGKFDADLVFLVEWPNLAAFTGLIQDPGYQAISHLRGEAIRDSLLIRFDKM